MPTDARPVSSMTPLTLKARLDAGEPLAVLDVREPFERAIAAIPLPPTALDLAIPMGEVPARLVELARLAATRPSIVVYCHHGARSMVVARWLASRGIAGLANLDGGIDAWTVRVDRAVPRY